MNLFKRSVHVYVFSPHRLTDRQTDRQTIRQTDRQTDKQTDRHTDRQTDRPTFGIIEDPMPELREGGTPHKTHYQISTFLSFYHFSTDRQTYRQTDRQTDRQTYRPTFGIIEAPMSELKNKANSDSAWLIKI